jgi:Mycothiol maleylpyruvate isomerase N-terminal domain
MNSRYRNNVSVPTETFCGYRQPMTTTPTACTSQQTFEAFLDIVNGAQPDQLTACAEWTVRNIVVHMVSGADEILRHLEPAIAGQPIPATRSFAEREGVWHDTAYDEILARLPELYMSLQNGLDALLGAQPDHIMPWTGRQMPTVMFRSHLRNEFAQHRWDIAGHDDISRTLLSDPSLTVHTVRALGGPLLAKAASVPENWSARLRSPELDDVVIQSSGAGFSMSLEPVAGEATVESSPDARLLLLWSRFAPDPNRPVRAPRGTAELAQLRAVLQGY